LKSAKHASLSWAIKTTAVRLEQRDAYFALRMMALIAGSW